MPSQLIEETLTMRIYAYLWHTSVLPTETTCICLFRQAAWTICLY